MKILGIVLAVWFVGILLPYALMLMSMDSSTATSFIFSNEQVDGLIIFTRVVFSIGLIVLLLKFLDFLKKSAIKNDDDRGLVTEFKINRKDIYPKIIIQKTARKHLIAWIVFICLSLLMVTLGKISEKNPELMPVVVGIVFITISVLIYLVHTLFVLVKVKFKANSFLTKDIF